MSSVEFHKFRENINNINDYTDDQKEKIFDNFIDQGLLIKEMKVGNISI